MRKLARQRYLMLMLLPAVLFIFVFCYIPLAGWVMAFKDYRLGRSIFGGDFIGLDNFRTFFGATGDALYVIRNTVVINLLSLAVGIVVAAGFAILVNELYAKWFKKSVQTISFLPFFISWVVTYSIVYTFFASTSGLVNSTLKNWGIIELGINFLGNPDWAWPFILLVGLWKSIGYNSIIYLAAISGIDPELYEAAEIDGAGRFAQIRYITIPEMMATIEVLLIIGLGFLFTSNFEMFYLFTNPSNWSKMEILDVYIYKFGLKQLDFSYATSISIVKTLASLVLLVSANYTVKRINGRSII